MTRWSIEQVEAVAPSAAAISAASGLASPTRWLDLGADDRVVWGTCRGSGAEPYDTAVDHVGVGYRCTCPSRKVPCKHALALLMLWSHGQVPPATPAPAVDAWMSRRHARSAPTAQAETAAAGVAGTGGADTSTPPGGDVAGESGDGEATPPTDEERDTARDERVEKMLAGLTELDRWLDDRMRTGLADPALARYSTWDELAARLVDAQAGSLANRVRRLAGLVGASTTWHEDVLAELGVLHLLSQAGRRLGSLPGPLADSVATTVGWQVRKADVLGGVPDTDHWVVAGRSDQREDRIEVRRHWLRGTNSGRWALILSFAAYGQSLDTSLEVGTSVHADLHRYPGPALRALVGIRHPDLHDAAAEIFPDAASVERVGRPPSQSIADACDEVGRMLVAEPWLDRLPTTTTATLARDADRWYLTDATGSMALLDDGGPRSAVRTRDGQDPMAMLLALSQGRPVELTLEWTPHGVTPLAVHLDDRTVDIGPRADTSFVSTT